MLQPLILLIVLIALNAVFASAEIAVISTNSSKLKKMAAEGNKKAERLLKLTGQPAKFLATIQVAITVAGLLQSAFASENFAGPLSAWLISIGVSIDSDLLRTICIVVITLVLAYFNLVFGELVPKRIAMKKSEKLALGMANMLYGVSKAFAPLVWLLTASTNGIIRIFGINPNENDETVTEEEIRMMLDEGNQQGTIRQEENEIIQNVFEFNDTSVAEICTHRRDIISLCIHDSNESWEETIRNNRHTFYPIYDKNEDDIVGILDTRDYFRTDDKSKENLLKTAINPPLCIPDIMTANVLFKKMKEERNYIAVIIDEYGCLNGIITLNDLLESLVGDICENDTEKMVVRTDDNEWLINGLAATDEVSEALGINITSDDYDTFNGYVCGHLGRIPYDHEAMTFETDDLTITINDVRNHMKTTPSVRLKNKTSTK